MMQETVVDNLGTRPAHAQPATGQRAIALWLLVCCALIFSMVVLGGITRLTGSGLSMVEWDPIFGVVPPLSQAEWEEVFHKYQQSPEYRKVNLGMTLEGFKAIYWVEYAHRLLGRFIGIAFLVPFLYFLARGRIERALAPKLAALFVLGGLQGLLGWYMVKSGLVNDPHVSQYRLTAHLGVAFIIYGYMLWVALDLLLPRPARAPGGVRGPRRFSLAVLGLIFITVLSGGFVAGLKAGYAYNTFPLMDGRWVPAAYMMLEPAWRNFFENIAAVQFDHRLLAMVLFVAIPAFWLATRRRGLPHRTRIAVHLLLVMLAIQITLGISTLLLHVPEPLASAHQAGALALFTIALFIAHDLRRGGS